MNIPKVNILLSTYNGEKYLACQLDSLLAQDHPEVEIYIRDDGSTDSTRDIIRSYVAKTASAAPGSGLHRVHYINDPETCSPEKLANLRHNLSFWTLLRECGDADYFGFCDQDDKWSPDKISRGVAALESRDGNKPLMYSSSFDYCDENLVRTGAPMASKMPIRFKDVIFYAPAFGFTILMNRRLRELVLSASDLTGMPHDCWTEMTATLFGEFVYDPSRTALYRRHSKTVTYVNASRIGLAVKWLKHDVFGPVMKEYRHVVSRLLEEYGSIEGISIEDRKCLELFSERKNTPSVYFRRLFFRGRLRPTAGGELALRLCFLLGR